MVKLSDILKIGEEYVYTLPKIGLWEGHTLGGDPKVFRTYFPLFFEQGRYRVSVQASEFHYCRPRETTSISEYSHVEIMLDVPQSDIPHDWLPYESGGVYACVPVAMVEELLTALSDKYGLCDW